MLTPIDRTTEREVIEAIDGSELERHVDALSDLTRVAGTSGERIASEYIVDTLDSYGVDAEILEHESYVSVPEDAGVEVTVPTARRFDDAITVSFSASTPPGGVHAEAVRLGEVTPETVRATPVRGRIAVVEGLPTPDPVGLLDDAGAAGVVFVSPTEGHLHEMIVSPVWGTPTPSQVDDFPDIPVAEVSKEAGEWLGEKLDSGPVELTVRTSVTTELRTLPCPVGRIDGSGSDRYFVVGNHVDSWHEGVTDNATAVATTLELARLFAEREPKRGLVFGFWSAHSTGRYAGSAWYADEYWNDLRENGVAYLHIDLPGLNGADSLWFQHMAELEDEHLDAMRTATDFDLREGDDSWLGSSDRPARNSDQSFWGTGLSSLLSGGRLDPGTEEGGPIGGGWWWHTPADTRDKVDFDVLHEETKLYVALAARICESPVLPHDYTATVDDIEETLSDATETLSFDVDFAPERERIERLRGTIERVNDVIEGAAEEAEGAGSLAAAEDVQVALGNVLIPALYMDRPPYEQEPAVAYAPLPGLRSDGINAGSSAQQQCFERVSVRRSRNRVIHHLDRAQRIADRFLDEHED
ncbi:M28 family peptidase [Halorubrum sp. JWXQ-INN 858]|uniref:M28 family peptidase n=1 Tax=Halorubrum sp. JWXQ-INN 858 TaxID=2690782 RepID=UPI00135A7680|nr:M28 family peptidase [Halorubrum sp. JWXQ-INN 858]MWV63881.1 M28 family peptidase [Halorubrum sp. JWXQ-INN 858]